MRTKFQNPIVSTFFGISLAVVGIAAQNLTANATTTTETFNGSGTNSDGALAASAVFNLTSCNQTACDLQIILSNTSTSGASNSSDELKALFWDYSGSPLSTFSMTDATAQNLVKYNGTTNYDGGRKSGTDDNLSGIWQAASSTSASLPGITQHYGIGSAGLGIFKGNSVSGVSNQDYGIITGYSSPNKPMQGYSLVNGSATFDFSVDAGFDITKITNVGFQYGTSLSDANLTGKLYTPPTPPKQEVPSTLIQNLAIALTGALFLRLRRRCNVA